MRSRGRTGAGCLFFALALYFLIVFAAGGARGEEIFADGFESGDAREWSESLDCRTMTLGIVLMWYSGDGPENEMVQVRWNDGSGWRDGQMYCPASVYAYGCHSIFHTGGTYTDVCVNVEHTMSSNGFMWLSLAEGCEP